MIHGGVIALMFAIEQSSVVLRTPEGERLIAVPDDNHLRELQ